MKYDQSSRNDSVVHIHRAGVTGVSPRLSARRPPAPFVRMDARSLRSRPIRSQTLRPGSANGAGDASPTTPAPVAVGSLRVAPAERLSRTHPFVCCWLFAVFENDGSLMRDCRHRANPLVSPSDISLRGFDVLLSQLQNPDRLRQFRQTELRRVLGFVAILVLLLKAHVTNGPLAVVRVDITSEDRTIHEADAKDLFGFPILLCHTAPPFTEGTGLAFLAPMPGEGQCHGSRCRAIIFRVDIPPSDCAS